MPVPFPQLLRQSPDRKQTIYAAKGCRQCDKQGYKGRMALLEILHFDVDMDEIIARHGTHKELMRMALSRGFKTLGHLHELCEPE